MIFRHLDATLPKYMLREFGASVPKGTIYSINPALIIILVPLVTAATTHMDPLAVIHGGTYISAASVMFLVMSTSIGACVGFVVVLSIGEAIWSPRLVRTNPCVETPRCSEECLCSDPFRVGMNSVFCRSSRLKILSRVHSGWAIPSSSGETFYLKGSRT